MSGGSIAKPLLRHIVEAVVLIAIFLLVSGRPGWVHAWIYVVFIQGFQFGAGIYLDRVNPGLMAERSRIRKGTKTFDMVLVAIIAALGPVAVWVVAALDVRSHWPPAVPAGWSAAAFAVCAGSSFFTLWAMAVNRFFSITVRIQTERGHAVADTGPYRYVRHPGYIAMIAFTLASPVALGSWRALVPAAVVAVTLLVRTVLEDRTLRAELAGYSDYTARVPRKLVPGLW
jgi:protein-S-isoprenylcysteine O-methyltransferase Ste14